MNTSLIDINESIKLLYRLLILFFSKINIIIIKKN